MANIPELQEAILKALDAVVTQRNNDLKLDKTITAIIKKNVGLRHGKTVYQVEYSGGTIEAVCQNTEDVYIPKTSVYVLVPQGDFSKEKIIIGRASSIVTDRSASIVAAAVNQFSIVGTNLLSGKNENIKDLQFGLRSFHPASADNKLYHNKSHRYQTLYDVSDSENKLIFDNKRLNVYKENSTALMVRADFLTNLDIAQRKKTGAKYGLIFNFVFENLNKGYGETNGEILKNISKDITFIENEEPKTVFELGETFINSFQTDINEWTRENTGFIDQFLEKINVAYSNFQAKNPEKNTEIITATMLAYQVAVSELKNCNTVNELKKSYNEWKDAAIGDSEDKVIPYTWTSDDMIGNPMIFNTWNSQYQVFNIDFETFDHLESIIFFKEGFIEDEQYEQKWPISEANNGGGPDIFVKNLQIYAMNPIEIQSGDYSLKVETDSGYDIVFDTTANDEEMRLKATLTRKLYEDLSGNANTSYIWFKEDSSVINAQSSNYHSLGGIGWRKISEGTSSSRFITIKSEDNQAYKNNYKCVAIYEPSSDDKAILAYPFVVFNSAAKIDIMLESDLGTHFSYDAGSPTIRVLIKDTDNENEFEEKSYPLSIAYPTYKYKWAIADSANNYVLFLDEIFENNNDLSENAMLSSVKQSQLNKIEKFVYINNIVINTDDPWRATRIKYPVSISSTGFTVTCYIQKIKDAYANEIEYIDVGSASLEFLNQADSITSDYRIQIVNGDQVFQYDEYGKTPTSTSKKDPLEILPLQVKLFTPSGIEVSGSNYQAEWIFPIENTLIVKKEDSYFMTNPATNLLQLIKGHEVNFDIAKIYDPNAYSNQITCHVSFGGKDYYKDTNFYFGKQGSNGTNGTDVIAKIEYIGNSANDDLSILNKEPLTLYLQTKTISQNNITTDKMFNVDKTWWTATDPFSITSDGNSRGLKLFLYQKNEEIMPTVCKWNIAGNPKEGSNNIGKYFQLEDLALENDTVANKIIFNDNFINNNFLIQNFRAKAEVKDKDNNQIYYAFYSLPIIWYEKINTNEEELIEDVTNLLSINRISIDKHFYLNEVVYNADGRNPIYNHNQGLKLINIPDSIKKIIFTAKGGSADTENTACIKLLNTKDDQDSNSLSKIILKRNEEDNTSWDIYNIIENREKFISTTSESMIYVLPDDIYDGSKTNNRIEAELYKIRKNENEEEINQKVATVFAPINMTLNTFGLASLNAWDGNTVTIDDESGYIMAPQIGAGEKDNNNRFTGVLMGKTETYTGGGDNEEEIGLFGYSQGLQSIFLDAKTGNATFGLPNVDTALDENGRVIYTNYHNTNIPGSDDYNEGRIELRPGDVSKIGGWRLGRSSLYYVTKFNYDNKDPNMSESQETHYYGTGLGEIGKPYRNDYVPVPKTGEIKQDNEKLDYIDDNKGYYKGYYNQYHIKDIPHKSSGILLQAGEYPYISIKGKPLNKDEVKEMNKINNSLDPDLDADSSNALYEESDSYLKEGDSLEIQLDPSAPSLFSIFRHNGSNRYEQKIDENITSKPKYEENTRTFLAGINGKGEFVANSISNVTTTLPAFITNEESNFAETSYTTNFAVNTIPAFKDYKASPTHIGFKMDVGDNTLGQLFISAVGVNPSEDNIKFWTIDDYNKDQHSIHTDIIDGKLIKDPTLRISGGRVNLDKNNIDSYGEYIRPIALHGRSISLFSYPTDYNSNHLNSEILFSNNHFVLESDENTSKAQLSLGDNLNSSNTLIHLKGYDDTDIENTDEWKGSYVNIATDLHKNIGIFNRSNRKIDYIKIGDEYKELWRYGDTRYIKIGNDYKDKWLVYPDFYIQQNNTYRSVKELPAYYKKGTNNYVSKNIIDNMNLNGSIPQDFYYYKIGNSYILASELKLNIYSNSNSIMSEDKNPEDVNIYSNSNFYWYSPSQIVNNTENEGKEEYYYFIKKANTTSNKTYVKGRIKDESYYYYYLKDSINATDTYYSINYKEGTITENIMVSQIEYNNNNLHPYIKLVNKDENNDIKYCYENDIQIYGYGCTYEENNIIIDKYVVQSATLWEKLNDEYKIISNKDVEEEKWNVWYDNKDDSLLENIYLKIKNFNFNSSDNNSDEYIYVLLKNINNNDSYYYLDNKYYKKDDYYYCYINDNKKYCKSNSITIDNNIYYKFNNKYISNVDWTISYFKNDNNNYFNADEIIFVSEYIKNNNGNYEKTDNNNNNDNEIFYKTTKIKTKIKEENKISNLGSKLYLYNSNDYLNVPYGNINTSNSNIFYLIDNNFTNNIKRFKKVKEENGQINYIEVDNETNLDIEYVEDFGEHYPVNNIIQKVSVATIPTKTEYYAAGGIEVNIGTSVDTYTTLKVSDNEILLNNLKTEPIKIMNPNSGFLLRTAGGELSFFNQSGAYESLFILDEKGNQIAQDIKTKLVIKQNNGQSSDYGLLLMNDSFALRSEAFGEISTNNKIWIVTNNIGNDDEHSWLKPQILLRAGSRDEGIVPNRKNAQAELILNSSTTRWNKLMNMSQAEHDKNIYNYPIFAVRTSGGNIGIYPEYFNNRTIYRENFVVNMNQSISGGLGVQDAYKGHFQTYYNINKHRERTGSMDHYIGIDSSYSIRTQNFVFAGGFQGNGTWIDDTTDLIDSTYGGSSIRGSLNSNQHLTLTISAPSINIKNGRVHDIYSDSSEANIDLSEFTTTQEVNNLITTAITNLKNELKVGDLKTKLNELINAYNKHTHGYAKPKESNGKDDTDARGNEYNVSTL